MAEYVFRAPRMYDLSGFRHGIRDRKTTPQAASLLNWAHRLLDEQEYDKAERVLREVLREAPEYPEALASLAICLAEGSSKFVTAEKLAAKSVKLAPRVADGYFALGYINLLGSRLEEGYRLIMKARELAPDDPRVQLGITTYERQREPVICNLPRDNMLNVLLGKMRVSLSSWRHVTMAVTMMIVGVYWLAFWLGM